MTNWDKYLIEQMKDERIRESFLKKIEEIDKAALFKGFEECSIEDES